MGRSAKPGDYAALTIAYYVLRDQSVYDPKRLRLEVNDTPFRSDVVEKVLRLCGILARLDRHPITRGAWLLKGAPP